MIRLFEILKTEIVQGIEIQPQIRQLLKRQRGVSAAITAGQVNGTVSCLIDAALNHHA